MPFLLTPRLEALLTAGCLTLMGCSSEFSRDQAITSFQEVHPEATAEQSSCVIDRLLGRYSLSELEGELEAEPVGPAFEEAQFRDMFACGVEGDLRTQITEQLVETGVSPEDAPCVSDALVADLDDGDIEVLLSGEITDEFYEKFFAAMDDCGAVNE